MNKNLLILLALLVFSGSFAKTNSHKLFGAMSAELSSNGLVNGQLQFTLTLTNIGDELLLNVQWSGAGITFDETQPTILGPGQSFTTHGTKPFSGCYDLSIVQANATTLGGDFVFPPPALSEYFDTSSPAPIITSVHTPNCTTVPVVGNMQITLTGLPQGNWTIYGDNSANYTYSGSGTTAVLTINSSVVGNGIRFRYETTTGCPSQYSALVSRNKLHDFDSSAPMLGFYVDANQDGIVNLGDAVNYQILIKNTAPCILQTVRVNGFAPTYTNPNLSFSGNPTASVDVAGYSTYTLGATYSITAQDIINGYVFNSTSVNPHWSDDLGGSSTTYFPNCTTQLNSLGIAKNTFQNFKSYPNPIQNIWEIANDNIIDKVEISNLLGQTVRIEFIHNSSTKIDLNSLSSGTYLAKISTDNEVKTIKIIKS
mgnify:CR=1 FL=1